MPDPMETIISKKILSTFDQLEKDSLDLHTLFEFVGGNAPAEREAVLDAVADLVQRGLLREESADFYARTESGRLAVANPREVTMYTREGCHLCDEAKAAMAPLLLEFGAKLREVDIDDDPVHFERYTDDVPVIFIGGQLFAQHRIDQGLLRDRLDEIKNS
jgi:glutaredoxin